MVRTKGSPDPLKRVRAFELSLFKVPYAVIAKELEVSERTVKRWVQSERAQRKNLAPESVREEIFLQTDQLLSEAWMNYRSIDPKNSAKGRMLRIVLAVLKFRAGLHGVGVQSEIWREIDELKEKAELVERTAVDRFSSRRDDESAETDSETSGSSNVG